MKRALATRRTSAGVEARRVVGATGVDFAARKVPRPDGTPASGESRPTGNGAGLLIYLVLGTLFGVVLMKAQVVSWFRIQEMFRFQAFHMYGVIGAAIVTAAIMTRLITRAGLRAANGESISIPSKELGRGTRYWFGGSLFGVGWALVGACPGPFLALFGSGVGMFAVVIASAVAGTWAYGALRPRLPH